MSRLELIAYRSWYGPLRRPFRAIARRLTDESSPIVWGPLKGWRFNGTELVCRLGIYELHVQYVLKDILRAGDVFYDVGANNGYLSLLGARCVESGGMVYAFEPFPQNAQRVRMLMAENGVQHYQLVERAISGRSGTAEFYLGSDNNTYTPSLIRDRRSQMISVETMTLDDFAAHHRRPHVIKIDIEGAEATALAGATKLLSSESAPKWLIEVHSGETDEQVCRVLLDHGYGIERLVAPNPRKSYPSHIIASR